MMKKCLVIILALSLSACGFLGGRKTRLVPQAYMPDPPSILMLAPKELQTIKQQPKSIVTDTKTSVEAPKGN